MFSANLSILKKSRPSDHLLLFIKRTHVYVTEVMQNKYRTCILSKFLAKNTNLSTFSGLREALWHETMFPQALKPSQMESYLLEHIGIS